MVEQEIKDRTVLSEFAYSFVFIPALYAVFYLISLFNRKVRRGLTGRRNLFRSLEEGLSKVRSENRIWFHASSMGEFEQAKPIIEILKNSGYAIVVSFFSPSGLEHSVNYKGADVITYIPLDSRSNARKFISMVKPKVAVVMRYDLWYNHLHEARQSGTKIILADATFPVKVFHRSAFLRDFYKLLYNIPHEILTTTAEHKKMFDFFLKKEAATCVGDTRFDRVYNRSVSNNMTHSLPFSIDRSKRTVLLLGSTWRQDLEVIADGVNRALKRFPDLTLIVVPHEPTADEVSNLQKDFPGALVFSELNGQGDRHFSALIVDRVGMLTQLYVIADVAYVGGGFGAGVHNVLEPAVYGIPIITGPRIERSDEAVQLLQSGGLFFIKDAASAYRTLLKILEDHDARTMAGKIARQYVDQHLGASAAVATRVAELFREKKL